MNRRTFVISSGAGALLALGAPGRSCAFTYPSESGSWDVIIAGAGLAGISAAIAAKESGADKVLIVEKLPMIGGHCRSSVSSFLAYSPKRLREAGITYSGQYVVDTVYEGGSGLGDKELITLMIDKSDEAMGWLEKCGVVWDPKPFIPVGSSTIYSFGVRTGYTGNEYIRAVNRKARELKVDFMFETAVTKLLTNEADGSVIGLIVTDKNGKQQTLSSSSVILATGGFTANRDMCIKYCGEITSNMPTTANPFKKGLDGATGDAVTLTEPLDANPVQMQYVQLIGFLGGRLLEYTGGDIYVNSLGNRFVNESREFSAVRDALLRQPGQQMWVITDSASRKTMNLERKLADGTVRRCASVKEAAQIIGCSADALEQTLKRYNGFVRRQKDEDFGKPALSQEIAIAPFYLGREQLGLHFSCGGLAFSKKAEVLKKDGSPIPGLYVAGEASGGLHGSDRQGGAGLLECVVFGRIAGEEAARCSRKSSVTYSLPLPPLSCKS